MDTPTLSKMILKNLSKFSKLLESSRIYLNQTYIENNNTVLNITPLLFNKSLVHITKSNSQELIDKVELLNQNKLTIPVSISENTLPEQLTTTQHILKDSVVDGVIFDKVYKELIEEDIEDTAFRNLIISSLGGGQSIFNSVSFTVNWDLILMQALDTPIYSSTKFRPAFEYKMNSMVNQTYTPHSVKNLLAIAEFAKKINISVPDNLSIDQIKEFRKDNASIHFRTWLERRFDESTILNSDNKVDYLRQKFNELTASYEAKNNIWSMGLGSIVGYVAGNIAENSLIQSNTGTLGQGMGALSGASLPLIINELRKRYGKNRWAFLLSNMKLES